MERITYRITLDAHKNGIQRTLQGFETSDKMSRRISINLVSGGDTYEIPNANVVAAMYVTTQGQTLPSINDCTINGDTIIYDCEPIPTEGITEMQLKLMYTSPTGARRVIICPKFAVEVTKSDDNDEGVEQTSTFTSLENAVAKADAVYNSRLLRIEISKDCRFLAYYADGTVYENDVLTNIVYNGNALLSESFAHGGTGTRAGEDTDNSMYYSNVSRSASEDAKLTSDDARVLLEENLAKTSATNFKMDFETGELTYLSHSYAFEINKETGELIMTPDDSYDLESLVGNKVDELVSAKTEEIDNALELVETKAEEVDGVLSDVMTNSKIGKVIYDGTANGEIPAYATSSMGTGLMLDIEELKKYTLVKVFYSASNTWVLCVVTPTSNGEQYRISGSGGCATSTGGSYIVGLFAPIIDMLVETETGHILSNKSMSLSASATKDSETNATSEPKIDSVKGITIHSIVGII